MNKPTATYDIDVATVIEDFEKKDSSAVDRAFLRFVRTGTFAIICLTISMVVHDIYWTTMIFQIG